MATRKRRWKVVKRCWDRKREGIVARTFTKKDAEQVVYRMERGGWGAGCSFLIEKIEK